MAPTFCKIERFFVVDTQQSSLPELERIGQPLLTVRELSLCCGKCPTFEERMDAVLYALIVDQTVELLLQRRVAAHELSEEHAQPSW